ncbi:MAG: phenylacetate--CoA ligase family protein [Promethearchaeota archaeon]
MVNYWNKEIETMDRKDLEELEFKNAKSMVKRVYDNIEFFRNRYKEAGLSPDDFKELDDLTKFPFAQKTDLRDNYPFGLFATPLKDVVRLHASSGTTGKPIVGGYTQYDLDQVWTEVMARTCVAAGMVKEDIVQNAYGYGLFTGGLGFHYGAEKIGATVIPISGGNTERQLMLMQDFGSTVMTSTPSYAVYLAEEIRKRGIKDKIKLRIGIYGAEPWSENLRTKIESMMGLKAIDIYGLTEIIGPGVSVNCYEGEKGRGLHIWEDHFLPEVVDRETFERVAPGEKGELIFSTLTRQATPLVRYRTKDISSLDYEKCPECGRTHCRHSKITGRSDDMLIIRGINVFPSQIEYVLMKIPGLGGYYEIIVERDILDKLTVRVELTPETFSDKVKDLEKLEKEIEEQLFNTLQVRCKVELVPPGTIPRSVGKAKRVIDKRKENI